MMWFGDMWSNGMGSSVASIMFLYAMFQQYFPHHLRDKIEKYVMRLFGIIDSNMQITFHEHTGDRFKRSEAYTTIESYLSTKCPEQAKRLVGDIGKNSKNVVLSMDDHQEVADEYQGAKLVWVSSMSSNNTNTVEKRYYILTFHKKYRALVADSYLSHVIEEGKAIGLKNKQRKLYTNNPSHNWYGYKKSVWSHVLFNHPSTFQTLAMDAEKKQEIIEDLTTFTKGKESYARMGKAWKRGYLLYGPPGTGKSTMIAAIANFLDYDIYDLELTAVQTNSELRKLLIEIPNKSIIVIEDIDCSLDLTGQRKKKTGKEEDKKEEEDPSPVVEMKEENKVTLSGLLNFIDGIWSACGGERIIIFTTNHVDKLDPALIRRGRMDKHIELSYCSFGAFKVLSKNYLHLDSHALFETIAQLLDETQMTPADVAENLMPKTTDADAAQMCLEELIQTLNIVKDKAKLKAEKEAANERQSAALNELNVELLTENGLKGKANLDELNVEKLLLTENGSKEN